MLLKERQRVAPSREQILSSLPEPFRSALLSMYEGDLQLGEDGEKHSLDEITGISPAEGMWIYELCRKVKPQATLEIGLAYGFSTIYFLAVLAENGNGHHSSIDPYQRCHPGRWAGIGLRHGGRFGRKKIPVYRRVLLCGADSSYRPRGALDIIFVDGRHLFDFALTDFTVSGELCSMGGHIILDDMWLPSIQRVVAFIRENREDFTEVETAGCQHRSLPADRSG